ncbi:hypothetical protein G6F24_018432 [Rhizopus arrhizus]|nr:hypothetical protein G6F24_018432 [Rhizopus arrhizus]
MPTTATPCSLSDDATSLSRPAQPPSPETNTASVSPLPVAGTSTTGRPFSAAGGGARLTPACAPITRAAATRPCEASPRVVRLNSRAIATCCTNPLASPILQP